MGGVELHREGLDALRCTVCGSDGVQGIYWLSGGCIATEARLQALCHQHVVTCEPRGDGTALPVLVAGPLRRNW